MYCLDIDIMILGQERKNNQCFCLHRFIVKYVIRADEWIMIQQRPVMPIQSHE